MRGVAGPAWGSALFFVIAPGVVAGVVPWSITRYTDPAELPVALLGLVVVALGLAALVACFVQFVREGRGTPAPVAPTEKLVVGGLYRWVRNPMYLAVGTIILGQAVAFASVGVLVWFGLFAVAVVSFVTAYEQPTLRRTYGASYDAYCRAVPAWWPRLTPWDGADGSSARLRRIGRSNHPLVRTSLCIAWKLGVRAREILHQSEGYRHLGRSDVRTVLNVRAVEEVDDQQAGDDEGGDGSDHDGLGPPALAPVGEHHHVRDGEDRPEHQHRPDRCGDGRRGFGKPRPSALSSDRLLIQPVAECDLAHAVIDGHLVDRRFDLLEPADDHVALAAVAHQWPLVQDDGACIAPEVTTEFLALRNGKQPTDARQLGYGDGLTGGPFVGPDVIFERKEHDEREKDRKRDAEHSEDGGGWNGIVEQALRAEPTCGKHQQDRHDRSASQQRQGQERNHRPSTTRQSNPEYGASRGDREGRPAASECLIIGM